MATVGITLGFRGSNNVPVLRSNVRASEAITSTGTSQATTMVAELSEFWRVTVSGGAVWLRFAASPTAAAGDDWLLPDGASIELQAVAGDKCAVIDA